MMNHIQEVREQLKAEEQFRRLAEKMFEATEESPESEMEQRRRYC